MGVIEGMDYAEVVGNGAALPDFTVENGYTHGWLSSIDPGVEEIRYHANGMISQMKFAEYFEGSRVFGISYEADPDWLPRPRRIRFLGLPFEKSGNRKWVTPADEMCRSHESPVPSGNAGIPEGMSRLAGGGRNPGPWCRSPVGVTHLRFRYARHYNLGRFLSPDPVSGNAHNPQSFNSYTYVLNNPLKFVDPYGLKAEPCFQDGAEGDTRCFKEEITVTAKMPGFDFGGPSFSLGLDSFSSGGTSTLELFPNRDGSWRVYQDSSRELLRVAGGGALYTNKPTLGEYFSWFGQSYYSDMSQRGIVSGGVTVGLLPPLAAGRIGASLNGGEVHFGGRIGSGQLKAFGVSGFLGAGLKFGSVGKVSTRSVVTIGFGPAVRIERLTDFSAATQYRVLIGLGSTGGFVDYIGATW